MRGYACFKSKWIYSNKFLPSISRQSSALIIFSTTMSNNLTGLACRLRGIKPKRPRKKAPKHSFSAKEPCWNQRRGAQQSLQRTQSSAED